MCMLACCHQHLLPDILLQGSNLFAVRIAHFIHPERLCCAFELAAIENFGLYIQLIEGAFKENQVRSKTFPFYRTQRIDKYAVGNGSNEVIVLRDKIAIGINEFT